MQYFSLLTVLTLAGALCALNVAHAQIGISIRTPRPVVPPPPSVPVVNGAVPMPTPMTNPGTLPPDAVNGDPQPQYYVPQSHAYNAPSQVPGPASGQAPNQWPMPPASGGASCADEHRLRSIQAQTSTSVTFQNDSAVPIHVFWLNYNGARVHYSDIAPGATQVQQTYVTHPWVLTRDGGECVGVYLPTAQPSRIGVSMFYARMQ